MYSDIIPPKKKFVHTQTEEYNSVRFSSPHKSYTKPESKKGPLVLFLAACVVIGLIVYQTVSHGTTFTITPKVSRFEIKQRIPLVLQGREKDSLSYSLVYVPAGGVGTSTRNPFTTISTSTTSVTSAAQALTPSAPGAGSLTITATTTGDVKHITLINKTSGPVALRKDTRFDVGGVTYTLDTATAGLPTSKDILAKVSTSTTEYKVIGFKGNSTYDTVFAVPEISAQVSQTTDKSGVPVLNTQSNKTSTVAVVSTTTSATSTIPPADLLSLMPTGTLALQKSTIYDKLVDQSAVVVFDQNTLEDYVRTYVPQIEDYYKGLKPFGESISYDVTIVDYTLETSPDTGKPVAFSSLMLEITPKIDTAAVTLQFASFSKDTMNTIQNQVTPYIKFEVGYTPFWTHTVASADRIKVKIYDAN